MEINRGTIYLWFVISKQTKPHASCRVGNIKYCQHILSLIYSLPVIYSLIN